LAGVYLRPAWVLYALLSLSWSIDFSEYLWGSGSTFCFSPAYGFLLPAYATLWLGGRWFARHYEYGIKGLTRLASAFFTSVVSCELFSSGGFYFLSGRFVNTSLAEFGERFVRYFPSSLKAMAFYVSLALVLHLALRLVAHRHSKARLTT
ncbi:MAG: hypothetical protein OEX00_10505, partial [Gammaproteobacteria bacterium]|nr:hypothetical protein [Gammaproteobacteria bacterium]